MSKAHVGIFAVIVFITLFSFTNSSVKTVASYAQLAQYHCQSFPVELVYRLSAGNLAQKYGSNFSALDCYIRQFVNQDGQDKYEQEDSSEEDQQQQSNTSQEDLYPQIDPIVAEYAQGLTCLPEEIDKVQAVYKIWRFYRYVIQHDYALQWMRAKIRSGLGYSAERPNSWMDGQQKQKRLRLDKLFSNEFYDYVDKLMFRDFLYPIITFLRKNVVLGIQGKLTKSGKPILLQIIESKNIQEQIFMPIVFKNNQFFSNSVFTYTIPGIPLFLGGSSSKMSWAFSGVLVDRSNIEQIQTVGSKFYHHGIQAWIKLSNVSIQIPVKDAEDYHCTFMHSSYGTLYEKHDRQGKVSEYIARWHEDQKKVRNLFTQISELIIHDGRTQKNIEFPFNSLLIANQTGLYHHICFQHHPSYFLYPDLAGQPDKLQTRWVLQPRKNFFAIVNTHLSTIKQQSYISKDIMCPLQEQLVIDVRNLGTLKKNQIEPEDLLEYVMKIKTDTIIKKRREHFIYIYRKAKFVFFPEEDIRKQCDQLITLVEKWDGDLLSQANSPVFILWDYYLRQYTFNHVSSTELGAALAKHKVLTDDYWLNQMQLWKKGVSYGQCDSHQWFHQKWDVRLNNSGLNCTCFFNVMRAINKTRQILRNQDGSINNIKLSDFVQKKVLDLNVAYRGSHLDQAFQNYFSRNLAFVSEIGNQNVVFYHGYKQQKQKVNLESAQVVNKNVQKNKEQIESQNLSNDSQL